MDFESLFRPGILGTRPYSPGKPVEEVQRELGLDQVIKLASNENPEGPLPAVVSAVQEAVLEVNRYPDATCFRLTDKLASLLSVDPQQLIFGNGSNEVLDILIRALVSPGENVVFSEHSFIVYPLTCGVHFECGRPVSLDADDKHDLPAMAAAVDDQTKLIIVCNPNNPTGTYNTRQEFESFLDSVPSRVIVAIDEAYYEYVTAEDYPQTLPMLADYPNLMILRTFSKIHSLAGLRVGYGIGHPDFISQLHKTREPFNVNLLSQTAAIACIDNWHEVPGRVARNKEQLDWMAVELGALGFEVVPSQTNFILVRCDTDAGKLTQDLLHKGIIVRPMHAFGLGEGAVRISIGLRAENEACIEALKKILN
ncbi:MAG: histidinol-phosphate transaminase [Gemmatimonadales bacterium]|nr:histidinol-phosphate transaminase [Gemmatimonadales bacterium]